MPKTDWDISIYVNSPDSGTVKTLKFPHRPTEAELGKAVASVFEPFGFKFTNNKSPEKKLCALVAGRAE